MDRIVAYCVIGLLKLLSFLPYNISKWIARCCGHLLYFILRGRRHVALANLYRTQSFSHSCVESIAKESFCNYAITCFDYGRIGFWKSQIADYLSSEGKEAVHEILAKGQGVVFVSGHQSNWEVPFLDFTSTHKAIAVGRPWKTNSYLYDWVVKQRESFLGKIIPPDEAVHMGGDVLSQGGVLGLVADQAHVPSAYSYRFLGVEAQTFSTPGLLAYKYRAALIPVTTKRTSYGYHVTYHPAIFPNLDQPFKKEVVRMMDYAFSVLEQQVKTYPGEWMWTHKFWKRVRSWNIPKPYRYDYNIIIAPQDPQTLAFFWIVIPYFFHWIKTGVWKILLSEEIALPSHFSDHELMIRYRDWHEGKEFIKGFQQVFDFLGVHKDTKKFEKWGVSSYLSPSQLKNLLEVQMSSYPEILDKVMQWKP